VIQRTSAAFSFLQCDMEGGQWVNNADGNPDNTEDDDAEELDDHE
jgi:hypothetical protein